METIGEIVPFAREVLSQRPCRGLLRIYVLGSALAMLGVVGGLVESVFLPLAEGTSAGPIMGKEEAESYIRWVPTDVVDMLEAVVMEVKDKHALAAGQRGSANRLHASRINPPY